MEYHEKGEIGVKKAERKPRKINLRKSNRKTCQNIKVDEKLSI